MLKSFSWLSTFFGEQQPTQGTQSSPVDVIVYVASLASSQRAIDPILDGLRTVTAKMRPGANLSQDDQLALVVVYDRLAEYLASNDPLRTLTKTALRQKIRDKFKPQGDMETLFWKNTGIA